MIVIKLYGDLRKRFIKEIALEVRTVKEAIRALESQFPKFRPYMLDRALNYDAHYQVIADDWELGEADLDVPLGKAKELKIVPVVQGSGTFGKIVAGVALLGLGLAGIGILGLSASTVALIGGTMALGGIVSLFNTPTAPDPYEERSESDPSLIFNGSVNTIATGGRVPIVYGRGGLIAGSQVISASVRTYLSDVEEGDEDED